jgi:hypothetical protein
MSEETLTIDWLFLKYQLKRLSRVEGIVLSIYSSSLGRIPFKIVVYFAYRAAPNVSTADYKRANTCKFCP